MCPLYKNAPLRERGVDRFARADTQSIKQHEEMELWRCGVTIIAFLQLNVDAQSKWLPAGIKTVILNTNKEMDTGK